ncbi:unnamed protein product [Cuscuta europaea]|uniref:FBD domain-containing protein n=1 Tax=Cuscuta europaea TaxID=41803 RepID=A0A9P1A140_CUSEU|nr:unnamed protein product [Cuscuta europaea]
MNLSGFRPSSSSSFACLLQIYFQPHGHPPLCLPELKLLEELDAVAQTCKLLHVLKFCFNGLGPEMHFIKTLLASFPTLEKVFIVRYKQYGNKFTMKEEFKIMSELLRFPRASKKAEIVYTSCNNHMCVECN